MTAAADARALVATIRLASLATTDRDSGAPFASLVATVDDGAGHPLMLLSGLAEHTRNLTARADASLLFVAPAADPASLDCPRVTLIGRMAWLARDDASRAVARITAALPEARTWAALPDFRPARLVVQQVRFVGGFARAATVPLADYLAP
jgi:putative heme iron utilization protein